MDLWQCVGQNIQCLVVLGGVGNQLNGVVFLYDDVGFLDVIIQFGYVSVYLVFGCLLYDVRIVVVVCDMGDKGCVLGYVGIGFICS